MATRVIVSIADVTFAGCFSIVCCHYSIYCEYTIMTEIIFPIKEQYIVFLLDCLNNSNYIFLIEHISISSTRNIAYIIRRLGDINFKSIALNIIFPERVG